MSPRRRSRLPVPTSASWIAARARNALRRPLFIAVVSGATFAVSLLTLVIVPQQARRAAAAIVSVAATRPDTEPTLAAFVQAERHIAATTASLAAARAVYIRLKPPTTSMGDSVPAADSLGSGARSRRDTLASQVAQIGRLIARSENAPLLGSYRALAQATPMQGDARVRQLLDTLVEIERERDSYSAVGGVDPVFVALTARANELGRSIEALADARRAVLKRELTALSPVASTVTGATGPLAVPDTLERIRDRDAAKSSAAALMAQLVRERAQLSRLDERDERARELANVGASPVAMLAAAVVFGAVFGFGIALLGEVRAPRIANAHEVERATGIRVLGVIRPLQQSPDLGRRSAERTAPIHIDAGADGHQLVYQAIATAGVGTVMLTITGDCPAVSAVVAINFAAIASDEARATLLVETDAVASPVMAALRLRPGAGISELALGTARWGEVTRVAQLGRDRSIDVLPSGDGQPSTAQLITLLQREASRLARQYDAVVLVSSASQVSEALPTALSAPDVVICARAGRTTIAALKQAVSAIKQSGANARGVVIWNADEPVLADLRPTEEAKQQESAVA